MFCDGGLGVCTVCKAAEGQLLTHCPGYALNEEALKACYNGNVKDFTVMKSWKEHGYDFRKKTWPRR
jgi:hypothetical protein